MPLFIYMDVNFCNFKKSPKSTQQIYIGPRVFNFTTTQEGEGTPSPTNVRPMVPGFSFERDDHTTMYVWGGSLDVTSGVLTVTHGIYTFTGEELWGTSTNFLYVPSGTVSNAFQTSTLCSNGMSLTPMTNGSIRLYPSVGINPNYVSMDSTREELQAIFISGIQMLFKLAQPVTVQLTPTEIQRCCEQLHVPYPVPPVADHYTTYDCTLHENTDIINPVIKLKTATAVDLLQWNYCYIPVFSRYYFVDKVEWNLGTWLIYLNEDTLASNKTAIGSSTQYVTRSASDYDGTIIDKSYETKVNLEHEYWTEMNGGGIFADLPEIWYVIGIIGGVAGLDPQTRSKVYNGSVVYYCMKQVRFDTLMELLLSSQDFNAHFNIPNGEISEPLAKQLINPMQYIHSIKAIPFEPQEKVTASYVQLGFNILTIPWNDIYIMGAYEPELSNVANGFIHQHDSAVEVPVHPDYHTRGSWVLSDPISKYILRIPLWGSIEIPCNIIQSQAMIYTAGNNTVFKVDIRTLFDMSTGKCTMRLSVNNKTTWFHEETKDLTVNIPFHQAVQNAQGFEQAQLQMGSFGANTVGGFLGDIAQVNIGSAIKRLFSSAQSADALIDSAQNANAVHISGNGSHGSLYSFHYSMSLPFIDCFFQRFVGEDRQNIGRPLMQKRTISTLSGYIQCKNANFSSSAFEEENNSIINYMNGGFFYE